MSSDWTDRLESLVRDLADDIIHDYINLDRPAPLAVTDKELRTVDSGTDDGCAYGTFELVINGGAVVVTVEASGAYQGEQDCWDWSADTHYTKTVQFDDLEDFEYTVKGVKYHGETAIDKAVDADINSREEKPC